MGKRTLFSVLGILLVMFFTACGGGGGSDPPPPSTAGLMWVDVSPLYKTIPLGTTQQFTVTGTYTIGPPVDLTKWATWESSNLSCAEISQGGLATSKSAGCSTTITVTYGVESDWTTLWVSNAALTSITVSPSSATIMAGRTEQFTAEGTYTDSTTADVTASITWISSNTSFATISNTAGSKGVATGVSEGTAYISAINGTIASNTASFTVTPAMPDLQVEVKRVSMGETDVTVTWRVSNNGTAGSGPFVVDVWHDLASPPAVGDFGSGSLSYTDLAGGAAITSSIDIPNSLFSGTAYAVVDSDGAVAESDETNNVSAGLGWPSVRTALFANSLYVEYSPGDSTAEASNLEASIVSLGHNVATFAGISAAEITAAGAGRSVMAFPKLGETARDLNAFLDAAALTAISDFVSRGGTLMVFGDGNGDFAVLLNSAFGFSIANTPAFGTAALDAAATTGTSFEGGPATLQSNGATSAITFGSLPASSTAIYNSASGDSILTLIPNGNGNVVVFGWDWFDAAPTGSADSGWLDALDRALNGYGSGNTIGYSCADVAETLGGTCVDTTDGFELTAPAGGSLTYGGHSFDDSSNSTGARNVCSLALFGDGGTVLLEPLSAAQTNSGPLQTHWAGDPAGCATGYQAALIPVGGLIDWLSYPTGYLCNDTDTDAGLTTLTCTYPPTPLMVYDFTDGLIPADFTMSGDLPWTIDAGTLRSGVITHNQTSCVAVIFAASSGVGFDRDVGSESCCDDLVFYVDGTQVASWSGTPGWANFYYPQPLGSHEYKWCYEKDGSVSDFSDAAWVDNVKIY